MSKSILRIRFLSLKDAANQSFSNVLLYVKKLTCTSTSCESPMILEEKNRESSIVLDINETFDLPSDDEYFQILFIESKSKSKVIADLIFWFNNLLDLVNNPKHDKNIQPELLCSATLEQNYIFNFTLQLLEENGVKREMIHGQLILGHLMLIKQFNQPVYCAICNRFIWGIHHQGYECSQCSLVTHRKCRHRIPFWCLKSLNPAPNFLIGDRRFEFHASHTFKHYEAPFVRSLVSGDHSYCSHCGSQVLRNALKCTKCHFIVHKHCESNIPSMCETAYNSIAIESRSCSNLSNLRRISIKKEDDNYSDCSSLDLTWLNPLPKEELIQLPKFSDFQCIGRIGIGRYAQVYCVQHIPSKEYVAIKVVDGLIEQARQQFEAERQILYRYSDGNPYMIKAYCTFHQGSRLFLVMEFINGDTLCHKIEKTRMNEDEIRFYLAEIISVLQYLHSNKIVYRDLKLDHIIISSEGHIRLVDYGLGRILKNSNEICHTVCGTDGYMAPEVYLLEHNLSENGYNYSVDYWALGIIFVQMLCGEKFEFDPDIVSKDNDIINHPRNFAENLELSRHISSEARSCLTGLLEIDPEKRLGSLNSPHGSIRDHPFFNVRQKINWKEIDEGLFKSIHKKQSITRIASDISNDLPFSTLLLERGACIKADWIAAGESTCTSIEEEQFKLFDYVNQSTWCKFNQLNSSSELECIL